MEIKWKPSMSVGEKTIDNQHKRLIAQINKLVQILSSLKVDLLPLRETMRFLYIHIEEHFSYEEEYMAKHNYPGLKKHKKIHQDFVKFYENLQKEFKEKITSENFSSIEIKELLNKVKKYLGVWMEDHLLTEDQKYAKYIKSHSK